MGLTEKNDVNFTDCADSISNEEAQGIHIGELEFSDEPPSYSEALQEMKFSFEFEVPPSYEDALTFTKTGFPLSTL